MEKEIPDSGLVVLNDAGHFSYLDRLGDCLIILDEFTTGLSYDEKDDLIRLLRILKNKYRKTIILLSKDTDFCYKITAVCR